MRKEPRIKALPGMDQRTAYPAEPITGFFDTIMVSFNLFDGQPLLTMTAVDDYGRPRQILAEVGLNRAIIDYLQAGINSILENNLLPEE